MKTIPSDRTAEKDDGNSWRNMIHVSDLFRVVASRSAESEKFNHVTVNQARIYGYLFKHRADSEPVRVKSIAKALDVSAAAASQAIDRLVRAGVVSRRQDPDDRRAVRLSFTERGKEIILQHERDAEALLSDLSSEFPAEDFETFLRVLAGIINVLEARWTAIAEAKAANASSSGTASASKNKLEKTKK